MDYEELAAPVKSAVDKFKLVPEFLKVRGLVKQHLDSFNYFVETGIKKIVRANNKITAKDNPDVVYLRFLDVKIGEPVMIVDGVIQKINPHTCRLFDIMYSKPILVNIEYPFQRRIIERRNVEIGRMPIMLRSCRCVLNGKDEDKLAELGECPLDPGGYFIIKGNEKVLLIQEQLSKNRIIIDTNKKGNLIASVTSSSENVKSKTAISIAWLKAFISVCA